MSRASQLAIAASRMALQDAGLGDTVPEPERAGVIVGTGMGGFERADESPQKYRAHGLSKVSPFAITSSLANMPSHHVSLMAQTLGPISCVVAACATGTQAIGESAELIRQGRADLVLAGGVQRRRAGQRRHPEAVQRCLRRLRLPPAGVLSLLRAGGGDAPGLRHPPRRDL